MAFSIKSSFILVAFLALAKGNYHYETFKVFNFAGESEPYRKPWFYDEYASPFAHQSLPRESESYAFESSSPYESLAEPKSSPEVYENPAESYFVASTKKIPREDKSFKKSVSPFYTLTDSDNEKYKEIVLKSGVPYCQETKSKPPKKRYRRDAMTCYKCKDPKNGATYEQCSYTSEPQETVRVDEYVPLPAIFRYRRSAPLNPGAKTAPKEATPKSKPGYRFSEEYFEPAASDEVPAEYEKKVENCKKVVKDSMVCMVCKDPETNGKYEQCSYTNQPKDKAYGYSKSSSFGLPQTEEAADEAEKPAKITKPVKQSYDGGEARQSYKAPADYVGPESSGEKYDGADPELLEKYFEEQTAAIKQRVPKQKTFEESEESARLESGSENAKDGNCKKILKDSMVCTVCKDPKTGGSYEQCSYAHNPNDKVYQFSRQKSFGYPEEAGKPSDSKPVSETGGEAKNEDYSSFHYRPEKSSEKENYNRGAEQDSTKYYEQPTERQESQEYAPYKISGDDVKSESERISDEVKSGNDCKKVDKDGMTCTVCKDPKTGGNFEQCSYAYQPNDKVFSFSRAKSFGSPESGEKSGYSESGESPSENYGSPEYGEEGSYGLATDAKPQVAASGEGAAAEVDSAEKIANFFSTADKKKEIEKVLSEFQQEDRTKCKKVIRDKLTCFQCKDKDGMQKEECIFVAAQEPLKDRLAYREVKEFQGDSAPAAAAASSKKQKRRTKKITPPSIHALEPASAASEYRERRSEPRGEADVEEESEVNEKEDVADAYPYDFEAETKPTYDKVLGITLPRYMLTTSEHEAEFDEVVASDKV